MSEVPPSPDISISIRHSRTLSDIIREAVAPVAQRLGDLEEQAAPVAQRLKDLEEQVAHMMYTSLVPDLAYATAAVILEKHRDNQKQDTEKAENNPGPASRLSMDRVAPEIAKLVADREYETKHLDAVVFISELVQRNEGTWTNAAHLNSNPEALVDELFRLCRITLRVDSPDSTRERGASLNTVRACRKVLTEAWGAEKWESLGGKRLDALLDKQ